MRWTQTYDPLGQPWLSTVCAALPIVALLGSLAFLQPAGAHGSAGRARHVAPDGDRLVFGMPLSMALASAATAPPSGCCPSAGSS